MAADLQGWHEVSPREQLCTQEQRDSSRGTHLRLWPAAQSFSHWLQQQGCAELGWTVESPLDLNLLELGSGVGWLGMMVARNVPGAHVTLTDLPGQPVCRLQELVAQGTWNLSAPEVFALDWNDLIPRSERFSEPFSEPAQPAPELVPGLADLHTVFGTDLCWDYATVMALAGVLTFFTRSASSAACRPRVIYGHWNRSSAITSLLIEKLLARGLQVKVLHPVDFSPSGGFLHELAANDSPGSTFGSKVVVCIADESTLGEPPDAKAPVETDEDWEAFAFQEIFSDAKEQFPDPCFLVFEIYSVASKS